MGALFNLSFDKFVAPTVAKIIYVLAMIGIAVTYVSMVAAGFNDNAGLGILMLLVLGPLAALVMLVFVRLAIESLLATIITAQNTSELVRLQGGNAAGGSMQWSTSPQGNPGGPAAPPAPPTV